MKIVKSCLYLAYLKLPILAPHLLYYFFFEKANNKI